ncbi:hypothetical protein DFH07DRAFT_811530 [Mycena maculata]|uniref:Protein kinase domain-containing protein n=1 Tax=Mycena maculata TaxID=230809 RepID=A0AAD7JKN2_9AGAR|nr:hypothetical protein DFH07DRAFT_811530 [Mycena maculata]
MAQTQTYKAVYFPPEGARDVQRLTIEFAPDDLVGSNHSKKMIMGELSLAPKTPRCDVFFFPFVHITFAEVCAARSIAVRALSALPSPSTCSTRPKDLYLHEGTLAGRPFGRCGPPTAIYDSRLAGLSDALRSLETSVPVPTPSKLAWAISFIRLALDFYATEDQREKELRKLIDEVFPGADWQRPSTIFRAEAIWDGQIFESKQERGNGGDPEIQCIGDYGKIVSDFSTPMGRFRDHSCLPTVLISQAGTQLDVCTAVFTDVVLVDHLYTMNFHDGFAIERQVLSLARLITTLAIAFNDLQTYYRILRAPTKPMSSMIASSVHLPMPVPNCAPFAPLTTTLNVRFLYKLSRITGIAVNPTDAKDCELNSRHAVFVALGGGLANIPEQPVIIKFTEKYNIVAHQKLAVLGLAPTLYHHSRIRGGWHMVVMEHISGIIANYWPELSKEPLLPHCIYQDVKAAIDALHKGNIVFGDLRSPNHSHMPGEKKTCAGRSRERGRRRGRQKRLEIPRHPRRFRLGLRGGRWSLPGDNLFFGELGAGCRTVWTNG